MQICGDCSSKFFQFLALSGKNFVLLFKFVVESGNLKLLIVKCLSFELNRVERFRNNEHQMLFVAPLQMLGHVLSLDKIFASKSLESARTWHLWTHCKMVLSIVDRNRIVAMLADDRFEFADAQMLLDVFSWNGCSARIVGTSDSGKHTFLVDVPQIAVKFAGPRASGVLASDNQFGDALSGLNVFDQLSIVRIRGRQRLLANRTHIAAACCCYCCCSIWTSDRRSGKSSSDALLTKGVSTRGTNRILQDIVAEWAFKISNSLLIGKQSNWESHLRRSLSKNLLLGVVVVVLDCLRVK